MKSTQSHTTEPGSPSAQPRRSRLLNTITYAIPLLAVSGLIFWLSQASADDSADATDTQPPPPTVTVAPVLQRQVVDRSERIGRVVATETVELRPEVSGRIANVSFSAGEYVTAGQLLFTIDSQPYAVAVEAANAEVARTQARADTALREANRATALHQQEAISSEEAELRRSRAAETQAELLAAQAALHSAEIDLERTRIHAPISGRVSRAYVTEGNLVSGNPAGATLLTTIVTTGKAHVYINVDEATIYRFRRAEADGSLLKDANGHVPVELRLDQSDTFTHTGYVESLDNRIDPQTGSLTVRLFFEDPLEELIPGAFVRVRIPVSAEQPRLIISERAVGTDQSQKFVLIVQDDQTVAYRTVTLGESLGHERIITAGLSAGEQIIVNGLQQVRPGMKVNAISQNAALASAAHPAR